MCHKTLLIHDLKLSSSIESMAPFFLFRNLLLYRIEGDPSGRVKNPKTIWWDGFSLLRPAGEIDTNKSHGTLWCHGDKTTCSLNSFEGFFSLLLHVKRKFNLSQELAFRVQHSDID